MPVQELKYASLQEELTETPARNEEEQVALEAKRKALDELLNDNQLAKYKLEVMFRRDRSVHHPFPGVVSFWESGTKLHGGGDSKLYLCPSKDLGKGTCEAFIPDTANGLNHIVCPTCGSLWKGSEVFGEVFYRLPVQKWSEVLLRWFQRLEHNADIRIKFAKDDIRSVALAEQEKQMMGEILTKARSAQRRMIYTYPLKNIIKDTAAGADLQARILAFLKA